MRSAFSITFALRAITATQLLVVPRSIPITSPTGAEPRARGRAGACWKAGAARRGRATRRAIEPMLLFEELAVEHTRSRAGASCGCDFRALSLSIHVAQQRALHRFRHLCHQGVRINKYG